MWTLKVILLLLPAVAYCGINIKIDPGMTNEETIVSFSGSDKAIISDKERKSFKVDDASLNKAVNAYKGNTCTSVFVKPPTEYGDLWEKHNWNVVYRTVRPVGYKVYEAEPKPDLVVSAEYINSHDKVNATYKTEIKKEIAEEISHSWSTSGEISLGQEINYSIGIGAASVGGSTSIGYTAGFGEEKSESKTVTLGTSSSIEVAVPAGQKAVARLTATQATVDVEIYYEATLSGDVFCNYEHKYNGHHFWKYPLRALQRAGKLPLKLKSTERISVGFYSTTRLSVDKE